MGSTTNFEKSFQILEKKVMILHENRLQADDSHGIACLISFF